MRVSSICFCVATELRTLNVPVSRPFSTRKMPRLSDVCTSPGMSMLIAATPFGARQRNAHTRRVECSVRALAAFPSGVSVRVMLGSATAYSARRMLCISESAACAFSKSASASASTASAWAGMAFAFMPLTADTTRTGTRSNSSCKTRPSRTTALARPLSISAPECPPTRPEITRRYAFHSHGSTSSPMSTSESAPPAQLTVRMPSSSESILRRRLPSSKLPSSAIAPSMPVSSSMVNTASSGGCSSSLLSSTASAIATAMPSSPPSVVPSADTQSPSTRS